MNEEDRFLKAGAGAGTPTRRLPHRRQNTDPAGPNRQSGTRWAILGAASFASVASFFWFFFHGEILLYGDAVAHINIARRVFDSMHPGPLQLGTVWLPLPHVLTIPFVIEHHMWTSGWGASLPSMIAYVLGVFGIYQLIVPRCGTRLATLAAANYGLNPNLLYLQSTAMTEPLFLALFIWALVYLDQFLQALEQGDVTDASSARSLENCGMVLAGAILTRYDGWLYSAIFGLIVVFAWWKWTKLSPEPPLARCVRKSLIEFLALCALVPAVWLAQNYALSARPLDFVNGPYSAKAIEARSAGTATPSHPGTGSLTTSAIFFLKAAKLNVSGGNLETPFLLISLFGLVFALRYFRLHRTLLLLLLPVPFYAYSVAYGSVPIFLPVWWPHSYYNVRYGIEFLPAFAVFGVLAFQSVAAIPASHLVRRGIKGAFLLVIISSYILLAAATPICLREAHVNSQARVALEIRLSDILSRTPDGSIIFMQTGEYVGALQHAGIPLRRVIWEGAHPEWDESLAAPAKYADYVVTVGKNDVWHATQLFPARLRVLAEFDTPDKPHVIVYKVEK